MGGVCFPTIIQNGRQFTAILILAASVMFGKNQCNLIQATEIKMLQPNKTRSLGRSILASAGCLTVKSMRGFFLDYHLCGILKRLSTLINKSDKQYKDLE